MPQRQTQHITHRFAGGWAPDFGPLVSGLPSQTSEIVIPYVLEAENVAWTLDGGVRKIGGTTTLGDQMESGSFAIRGLYDYWRIGTAGSATRRKVCHVGTKILEDNDTSVWGKGGDTGQSLFSGLDSGKHPNYSTFADLLILTSDSTSDVPKSWDQTTAQDLQGGPPNFSFSTEHKNRQWAAGNAAFPSRLYYCAADDPEDWTGAGSGFIDISPGDGDEIRGIASFKDDLWVMKGPYKGSIHRIIGSTPSDFQRKTFVKGLACIGHSTITQFQDDLVFMTPSGSIRSLKATAAFGDFNDAALTAPINDWLVTNLNKSVLKSAWVVNDAAKSRLYAAVPTAASTTNDTMLCYDYQFAQIQQPNRWSRITSWDGHSLATFISSGDPQLMLGGADGYARTADVNARSIDGTGTIRSFVHTPHLNYGSSSRFKTITEVGMTLSPKGKDTVEFIWDRDSQYENSVSLDQGGGGVELGDASAPDAADFMLDQSELGGLTFTEVYADLEEGGDFRWIQYRFAVVACCWRCGCVQQHLRRCF